MSKGRGLFGLGMGLTRTEADGLYIRRFVDGVLAGDTWEQNASGAIPEVVLGNQNGPVQGRLPLGTSTLFLESLDGGRFAERLKVMRASAASLPIISLIRARGTLLAPTQVLSGDSCGTLEFQAVTDGNTRAAVARIDASARENITTTAQGGTGRLYARDLAGTTERQIWGWLSDGAGIGRVYGLQTITRIVPAGSGTVRIRNNTNTADLIEVGSGIGFFGTANIAKPTITGAKGGNAALASLLTQGAALGLWTDSTTA
jgi:hypothetical protein